MHPFIDLTNYFTCIKH